MSNYYTASKKTPSGARSHESRHSYLLLQFWGSLAFLFVFNLFPNTSLAAGLGKKKENPSQTTSNPLILSTTSLMGDLVEQIAGPSFNFKTLMGPGVDPHIYKVKSHDLKHIRDASLVFFHGLHLEGQLYEKLKILSQKEDKVINVGQQVQKVKELIYADNVPDPHIWFSPQLWKNSAFFVADALSQKHPDMAKNFLLNYKTFSEGIEKLEEWAKAEIEKIPNHKKVLITSHDAFRYLGRDFGIEVLGIQGISTDAEASLGDIARIIKVIQDKKIPSIFVENSVSRATIEQVQNKTGCKIGEELFSDALGGPESGANDYWSMFQHNIRSIVTGLSK